MFQTTSEWVILGLTLLLGWILGLMSRRGAGPVRRQLAEERKARDIERRELEGKIAHLERGRPVTPPPREYERRTVIKPERGPGSEQAQTSTGSA